MFQWDEHGALKSGLRGGGFLDPICAILIHPLNPKGNHP